MRRFVPVVLPLLAGLRRASPVARWPRAGAAPASRGRCSRSALGGVFLREHHSAPAPPGLEERRALRGRRRAAVRPRRRGHLRAAADDPPAVAAPVGRARRERARAGALQPRSRAPAAPRRAWRDALPQHLLRPHLQHRPVRAVPAARRGPLLRHASNGSAPTAGRRGEPRVQVAALHHLARGAARRSCTVPALPEVDIGGSDDFQVSGFFDKEGGGDQHLSLDRGPARPSIVPGGAPGARTVCPDHVRGTAAGLEPAVVARHAWAGRALGDFTAAPDGSDVPPSGPPDRRAPARAAPRRRRLAPRQRRARIGATCATSASWSTACGSRPGARIAVSCGGLKALPLVVVPTYNERENVGPLMRRAARPRPAHRRLGGRRRQPRRHRRRRARRHGRVPGPRGALDRGREGRPRRGGASRPSERPRRSARLRHTCSRWTRTSRITRARSPSSSTSSRPTTWSSARATSRAAARPSGASRAPALSWLANKYIALVAGIPVRDTTSGYRGYRRAVLEATDFERIKIKGFVVHGEMAYQAWVNGFRLGEVPIHFKNRARDASKLTGAEIYMAAPELRPAALPLRVPPPAPGRARTRAT